MNTAVEMVSAFYLTVGNPAPEGELKEIAVQKVNDPKTSGLRALFTVENSGYTNLRGIGSVEVLDVRQSPGDSGFPDGGHPTETDPTAAPGPGPQTGGRRLHNSGPGECRNGRDTGSDLRVPAASGAMTGAL